jgi:hypothetical protein
MVNWVTKIAQVEMEGPNCGFFQNRGTKTAFKPKAYIHFGVF